MQVELIATYKGEKKILQVDDDSVIFFPDGLVGFLQLRRFVLLEDPDEAPIAILQSIDDISSSFLVTDPWLVLPDYKPKLSPEDMDRLELKKMDDAQVLCILAAKEGRVLVTANLLGPIVINSSIRRARQVILQDSPYSAQHPVLAL